MVLGRLLSLGSRNQCELHGGHARTANRTLLIMLAVGLGLIVWHVWVYGPSSHSGEPSVAAGSLAVQVARELGDLLFSSHGILAELRDVLPYFLVGVLLAGYLRTFKIAVKLQASLRRYGSMSVVVASLVGIITPLCACGTLTTAVSLLLAGLPLAPVMALMTTSALLSPSTYLITLNDLGPEWTVIRTFAALFMGLFSGYVTLFLCKRGFDRGGLFIEGAVVPGDFHDEDYPIEHLRCNCREKFGNRVAVRTGNKFLVFLAKSAEMAVTVGKYVLVGVAIGAVVERYIPYEWIYRFFGGSDPLNILWVTLASVPLFLHQISASSILAHIKNSLPGTLDGGVGLAFMIGGPVTAIPTMVMFWTLFRKRVFILYLFVCLAGTILIAGMFQWLVFMPGVDTGNHLLRGVSSLAGGPFSGIHKSGENVRIALSSPGGNVIATYTNEVAGHGGAVFDAGFGRLTAASAGDRDNSRYVANLADWLEQSAVSPVKGKVLLYTVARNDGSTSTGFRQGIAEILRQQQFTVMQADRNNVPKLTESILADAGQVWLFFPEAAGSSQLSEEEVSLLAKCNERGTGMLIALGNLPSGSAGRLASHFGIAFSGGGDSGSHISVGGASSFFVSASEVLGRFLKIVNKA